ncbi:MAG: AbrB/MazE/SpoVT family DNA-binding domain-containing protein [Mesorhizobium sp.]|nr:AbrB/MazE/SpoVT family DNA-binding domain-containing protein [Mesorhizobium sp.]
MAASKGFAEDQEPFGRGTDEPRSVPHARLKVDKAGRIVIPAETRAAMGVSVGDQLVARLVDGELRLLSREAGLRRAQQLVRKYVPEGTSLVDELLAERRAEAGSEDGA